MIEGNHKVVCGVKYWDEAVTKSKAQTDLQSFIDKEMRALAGEYFEELWEEIEEANLDVDVIGEVMIGRILGKIAISKGEDSASKVVAHFAQLNEMGVLAGDRVLQ